MHLQMDLFKPRWVFSACLCVHTEKSPAEVELTVTFPHRADLAPAEMRVFRNLCRMCRCKEKC